MKKQELKNVAKNVINYVVNSYFFVVIIGILIFVKAIFFYNNTIALNNELQTETMLGTLGFVTTLMCFITTLPRKARTIVVCISNILISILLFADNIYYIFSNNVLSVAQISNLQYTEQIISTFPSLLEMKYILYFIDILILILLFATKLIKINKDTKLNKKKIIIKLILGLVGISIAILCCHKYIENGKTKSYNKDLQIRESTIFGYHVSDIENTINYKSQAKYKTYSDMENVYDELKEKYENEYGQDDYNLQGIAQNGNIIILQLESIQDFVINKQINGKEITPNLNKFLNENIRFTNMHMQSYSTTADSEHSVITSTYPMENGMSFSRYYTNTYDDLFKIFNNVNYCTSYMHGNYPYFWNRGNVYGRLNLNSLDFVESFEDVSERINGDLSDELLYTQAVQKISKYEEPFLANLVSASSHTPFTLDGIQNKENKISIDVGKYTNTYFGNYLEAANYADYAFGIFIDKLKENNLYDDTTILIYGDHNGLTMYDEEMVNFLKQINPDINDVEIKLNYTRVAAGIKIPEVQSNIINKPVNKLDIKPTLAYLFKLEDRNIIRNKYV